jgi:transposase
MKKQKRYSEETKERAVRLLRQQLDQHASEWEAIRSIASKMGCNPDTLRKWFRQAQRDEGERPGPTTEERQRLKELERENRELRRANEILRKASAFFAQAELDRRPR